MTPSHQTSRLWETALALNRAAAAVSPGAAALPPLIFLTDPERTPEPWRAAARLPRGAAVIHRGFGRPDARDVAERLRAETRRVDARLLIALDEDLAEAVGADGLHLPEARLDRAEAVRRRRPDWLVTAALHDGGAPSAWPHARLLSPVFAPGGASAARKPLGLARFRELAGAQPQPVLALGGIDADNAALLRGSGAAGLCAVGALAGA